MDPLAELLDSAARRRDRHVADYAAFMAAHGARDTGGLSHEEARELFAILLAAAGLDA
jgi:hypothetical protein